MALARRRERAKPLGSGQTEGLRAPRGRAERNVDQPIDGTAPEEVRGAMNQVKCPHCFSTTVTIVSSDETREVMTIQCLACGKVSEIDTEHFLVDTEDLPQE